MFTGIIEEMGSMVRVESGSTSGKIQLKAHKVLEGTKIGDSIAVNGVCLTVVELHGNGFTADVMPETLKRSNLGQLAPGSRVNLVHGGYPKRGNAVYCGEGFHCH